MLSLTLDGKGNPHIAYLRAGRFVHASKQTGSWTTEVVDSIAGSGATSTSTSGWTTSFQGAAIAIANDLVHVVYIGSPPILRHAVKVDGQWSGQAVDERTSSFLPPALGFDAGLNPHILYCGYPSPPDAHCSLKYAFRSSGVWHVALVDSTTTGSGRNAADNVAFAIQDRVPHVVFMKSRGFQYTLRYASKGSNWFIETITEDGGEDVSLALDSKGRPHVAWAANNVIRHAWRTDGAWRVEEFFEPAEPTWSMIAIGVDAQDNVHIAHCYEGGVRHFMRKESDDWDVETVEDKAFGVFPFNRLSMALDDRGQPHIAYIAIDEFFKENLFMRYAHLKLD